MDKLNALYKTAEKENIKVYCFDMPLARSMSLMGTNDGGTVAIDPFALETTADETVRLAHEIGHCVTGSFYNRYSNFDIRAKAEYRADKWAVKKLVPLDELKEAFSLGFTTRWELAEYFDVTEDFIQNAMDLYHDDILLMEEV